MNNVVMREVTVGASYAPLNGVPLVCSVEITTPSANAGAVYFQGDDGSDVPWEPGEWHPFRRVDLSKIRVKGTPGDKVSVIGGTW